MPIKTAFVIITPTEHVPGAGHIPQAPARTLQTAVREKDWDRDRQQPAVAARVWQPETGRDLAEDRVL
jgi:hypothetical protein